MIKIHQLVQRGEHRQPSSFPVAQVAWDEENSLLRLVCRDKKIEKKLREYFDKPIWVRIPVGDNRQLVAHEWDKLESQNLEHFEMAIERLRHIDMVAILS